MEDTGYGLGRLGSFSFLFWGRFTMDDCGKDVKKTE